MDSVIFKIFSNLNCNIWMFFQVDWFHCTSWVQSKYKVGQSENLTRHCRWTRYGYRVFILNSFNFTVSYKDSVFMLRPLLFSNWSVLYSCKMFINLNLIHIFSSFFLLLLSGTWISGSDGSFTLYSLLYSSKSGICGSSIHRQSEYCKKIHV